MLKVHPARGERGARNLRLTGGGQARQAQRAKEAKMAQVGGQESLRKRFAARERGYYDQTDPPSPLLGPLTLLNYS
jgi:hypothetical protein